MGTNYKTFKAQFYELYTQAKYQEAIAHYKSYIDDSGENTENVHGVYARFRREDHRSQLITIGFVIFLTLLVVILFLTS